MSPLKAVVRLMGVGCIAISLFLILQSTTTVYYDFDKKLIQSESTAVKAAYAEVDKIGFVSFTKKGSWYNLHPQCLLFMTTLLVAGTLMQAMHKKFLLTRDLHVFSLFSTFFILLVVLGSCYVIFFYRYRLPYVKSIEFTILVSIFITSMSILLILLTKKQLRSVFSNLYSIIWLILVSIIIGNGYLIDTYSSKHIIHAGDFAQMDYLGIAIYTENFTHNWTFTYSIFRGANSALMLLGLLIASILASQKKNVAS